MTDALEAKIADALRIMYGRIEKLSAEDLGIAPETLAEMYDRGLVEATLHKHPRYCLSSRGVDAATEALSGQTVLASG